MQVLFSYPLRNGLFVDMSFKIKVSVSPSLIGAAIFFFKLKNCCVVRLHIKTTDH